MEEIEFCLEAAQEGMQNAVDHTVKEFSRVFKS